MKNNCMLLTISAEKSPNNSTVRGVGMESLNRWKPSVQE